MSKKRIHRLKKMHPTKLIKLATNDDEEALDVLIDRQQEGMGLRFYFEPRHDLLDDGYVAMSISDNEGSVLLRSGRPHNIIILSQHAATELVTGLAESVRKAWRFLSEGDDAIDDSEMREYMNQTLDEDFEIHVAVDDSGDQPFIEVGLMPPGAHCWFLGFDGSANLMSMILDKGSQIGWDIMPTLSNENAELVNAMIQIVDS